MIFEIRDQGQKLYAILHQDHLAVKSYYKCTNNVIKIFYILQQS